MKIVCFSAVERQLWNRPVLCCQSSECAFSKVNMLTRAWSRLQEWIVSAVTAPEYQVGRDGLFPQRSLGGSFCFLFKVFSPSTLHKRLNYGDEVWIAERKNLPWLIYTDRWQMGVCRKMNDTHTHTFVHTEYITKQTLIQPINTPKPCTQGCSVLLGSLCCNQYCLCVDTMEFVKVFVEGPEWACVCAWCVRASSQPAAPLEISCPSSYPQSLTSNVAFSRQTRHLEDLNRGLEPIARSKSVFLRLCQKTLFKEHFILGCTLKTFVWSGRPRGEEKDSKSVKANLRFTDEFKRGKQMETFSAQSRERLRCLLWIERWHVQSCWLSVELSPQNSLSIENCSARCFTVLAFPL